MSSNSKALKDNVSRVKNTNVPGIATFVGLRTADALLQYTLLKQGWAARLVQLLGGTAVAPARVLDVAGAGGGLGLQPYYALVAAMAAGSSLKHAFTITFLTEQDMPPATSAVIALFNTVFNSFNTVFSVWAVTSLAPAVSSSSGILSFIRANPVVTAGAGAYLVGILTETISELQRRQFKKNPAHRGQPYAGGLFGLARHINYGGYTVWRTGYALTTGGPLWAAAVFAFFFSDFVSRGVPVLDQYLSERYGEKWTDVKKRVPYRLFPGIY